MSIATQVTKVELAEFLTKEGAYDIFDATEVTEVMQRFDKDGNGHLSPDEMLELRSVLRKSKWRGKIMSAVSEPIAFPVDMSMSRAACILLTLSTCTGKAQLEAEIKKEDGQDTPAAMSREGSPSKGGSPSKPGTLIYVEYV